MDELLKLAKEVNDILPEVALRRNSIYYELATYINHVIAFLVCEKYDAAGLFVMRAAKQMQKYDTDHKKAHKNWFLKCGTLLINIQKYYEDNGLMTDACKYFFGINNN